MTSEQPATLVSHSLGGPVSNYYEFRSAKDNYVAQHTNHDLEIAAMRADSEAIMDAVDPALATLEQGFRCAAMMTAAALLEVHDATGISLDTWTGPLHLVEMCLRVLGYPEGTFLRNGV